MPRRRPKAPLDLLLRPAADADRDAIARIWLDGWLSNGIRLADAPTYAGLRARVGDELADGWRVTVAEQGGAVIGFVALRPDRARLEQIFITPDRHGQGVGRALFAAARAAMPGGFELWTHGENHRAGRFYDALGPVRQEAGLHPRGGHPIVTYWF